MLNPGVVSTAKPNKSVTPASKKVIPMDVIPASKKPTPIDLTDADNAPANATADMSCSTFSPNACLDTDRLKDIG